MPKTNSKTWLAKNWLQINIAKDVKLVSNVEIISNINDYKVDKIVNRLFLFKKSIKVIDYLSTYSVTAFNFL